MAPELGRMNENGEIFDFKNFGGGFCSSVLKYDRQHQAGKENRIPVSSHCVLFAKILFAKLAGS